MISIIIPVYNVEQYVAQCLDSVLSQTSDDYEVIIVDDGSTDKSGEICDNYANQNERIHVFHKTNGGLSDARNFGIDNSTGEYLMFVDSDDWIDKNSIFEFSRIITDKHPDVIISTLVEVYDNHNVIKDKSFISYLDEELTKQRAIKWIMTISETTWPAQKMVVSRKLINKYKLRFLKGRIYEDIDWTSRVCYVANTYEGFGLPWYYLRMTREGSITNTISPRRISDAIEIGKIHYKIFKDHPSKKTNLIFGRIIGSVYSKLVLLKYCDKEDLDKIEIQIKQNLDMFAYAPTPKHKLFYILMRFFGVKKALKVRQVIRRD